MHTWSKVAVALLLLPTGIHALVSAPPVEDTEAWIWSPEITELDRDVSEITDLLADWGLHMHVYQNLQMVAFMATPTQADLIHSLVGGDLERNQYYDFHLDRSVPAIEADVVAKAVGSQRTGPSVLVIDTGVDSRHPDFQDGNLAANFGAERFGGLVTGTEQLDTTTDQAGHGTHVAGIVAGSGASLNDGDYLHDRFKGVYANGRIVGYQAVASGGEGTQVDTLVALEAIDWAMSDAAKQYKVQVIQASWGTGGDLDPKSSVTKATLDAYLDGLTVIFSAGNRGREAESLNSFCQAPWSLCVANVDNSGKLDPTSSVGTSTPTYRPYAHPDIAAPGQQVTATASVTKEQDPNTATVDQADPNGLFGKRPSEELYEIRTGTSMSAPHVSGAVALLLAANPSLSPDQIMDVLLETATPLSHSTNEVGKGMLNVREAYNLAVRTPGNRLAFETGAQVKYGGPATGDDLYSQDAFSVGYTATPTGSAVQLGPSESLGDAGAVFQSLGDTVGIDGTIVFWIVIGVAGVLLLVWLIRTPARRRNRHERKAAKAARKAAKYAAKAAKY